MTLSNRVLAFIGATTYAATGAFWGSMNARWFGLASRGERIQFWLGLGVGFVLIGFAKAGWAQRLKGEGWPGRWAVWLLMAAAPLNAMSAVIEFALFGTLALGFGLVLFAVVAFRRVLMPSLDRWLVTASAVASLTWNTETLSVWLLAGVGLIWMVLSVRLIPVPGTAQPTLA